MLSFGMIMFAVVVVVLVFLFYNWSVSLFDSMWDHATKICSPCP